MRRSLALALLLAAGCASRSDLEASRRFEEANRIFGSAQAPADFLKAASLYESILASGTDSGAVLYNLGNAYLRAGRRGSAIAAYRRALRYRPRDPFLEANLASALAGRGGPESRTLLDHVLFWHRWLSYREKGEATAAAATILFLCAMGSLLFDRRRRVFLRGAALAGVLSLALGLSAALDAYESRVVRHGVVTGASVVARKGNAPSYEPAFTEPLKEGAEFIVTDDRGEWIRLRLSSGLEGWVPRDQAVLY